VCGFLHTITLYSLLYAVSTKCLGHTWPSSDRSIWRCMLVCCIAIFLGVALIKIEIKLKSTVKNQVLITWRLKKLMHLIVCRSQVQHTHAHARTHRQILTNSLTALFTAAKNFTQSINYINHINDWAILLTPLEDAIQPMQVMGTIWRLSPCKILTWMKHPEKKYILHILKFMESQLIFKLDCKFLEFNKEMYYLPCIQRSQYNLVGEQTQTQTQWNRCFINYLKFMVGLQNMKPIVWLKKSTFPFLCSIAVWNDVLHKTNICTSIIFIWNILL
jgi:hypothetical protein